MKGLLLLAMLLLAMSPARGEDEFGALQGADLLRKDATVSPMLEGGAKPAASPSAAPNLSSPTPTPIISLGGPKPTQSKPRPEATPQPPILLDWRTPDGKAAPRTEQDREIEDLRRRVGAIEAILKRQGLMQAAPALPLDKDAEKAANTTGQ